MTESNFQTANFADNLAKHLAIIQEISDRYFAANYSRLTPPLFVADPKGKRYIRIIQKDRDMEGNFQKFGGSAHGFIDTTNGDVLFSAGWKGPAKHARGNIYDDDHGRSALNANGSVKALR
jgi:hypothetical protein